MLFTRATSCVARRRQYQLHYGTLDFNHPSVQTGTWEVPAAEQKEHETATQALIECVRNVTEDLARWKVESGVRGEDLRSETYWHACRVLLLRHVYRRSAHDEECQQSAAAVLRLCDSMSDGKIEYLNWVSTSVVSVNSADRPLPANDHCKQYL